MFLGLNSAWALDHHYRDRAGIQLVALGQALRLLRTTPALLGLFSLVTLFAHEVLHGHPLPVRRAAWYAKELPTFSDTLAFVRQRLWPVSISYLSPAQPDVIEIPRSLFHGFTDTLAYAA